MIIRLWSSYNTSVSSDGWSCWNPISRAIIRITSIICPITRWADRPLQLSSSHIINFPRPGNTWRHGNFCGGIGHVDKHLQGHNSYRALTVVLGQLRRETLRIFCVTRDLKESLSLPSEKSLENNRLLVSSTFCTKKINGLPCDLHHHSHTRVFLVAVRWSRRKRGEGGSGSVGSKVE